MKACRDVMKLRAPLVECLSRFRCTLTGHKGRDSSSWRSDWGTTESDVLRRALEALEREVTDPRFALADAVSFAVMEDRAA